MSYASRAYPPVGNAPVGDAVIAGVSDPEADLRRAAIRAMLDDVCRRVARQSLARTAPVEVKLPS